VKRTAPWPVNQTTVIAGEYVAIPVDAETFELSPEEVLAAMTFYVGTKLGVSYKGYGSLNLSIVEGKVVAAQVSIWRPS
jgi:hypothetical protein